MSIKHRTHTNTPYRDAPLSLRQARSSCVPALTRPSPSAIVRSPTITHRIAVRTAHARRVAHFATPAVAFISQVQPLAR